MPPSRANAGSIRLAVSAGTAAFALYFCMYAFRKPFTVASFDGMPWLGMDYKIVLILLQVIGYAISKFFGIKFISEMGPDHRWKWILICMAIAGLSLYGFAMLPYPYNAICLFLNGLPLGLIWGLVFSYLEGRRTTEIMAAILSASFIVASGVVKTVGQWLMLEWNVSAFWMPLVTAALFTLPLMFCTAWLHRTPPPTEEDVSLRKKREPMNVRQRLTLFRSMAPGLILLIAIYMAITAFRDFRDNFAPEIWAAYGITQDPGIFTRTEMITAVIVLTLFASIYLVRDNRKAFQWLQRMVMAGLLIIGTACLANALIPDFSGLWWMVLLGSGLYLAYFPFNSILFDRLMACADSKGNAGYLIYLADAFGYLGSIMVLLYKSFFEGDMQHVSFLQKMGIAIAIGGIVMIAGSQFYFDRKHRPKEGMTSGQQSIEMPVSH